MTMAKKRREIPEKQPQPPSEQRVLPMQLKLGDRLGDASGEYEVIGRPYVTTAAKMFMSVSAVSRTPTSR
jgi:hypothetical protein